ncbi:MAG TPA: nickel ABC transporter permease [Vicinamibacterales bacterium]|nr:nickel ABC transporter permease [Vicinamibacterales bacterium]
MPYLVRRLASLVVVLVGVSTLSFTLGALAPGDPAELFLERALARSPTDAQVAEQRRHMGLDRPLVVRYFAWLQGVMKGDLGSSWGTGRGVFTELVAALPKTILLATTAFLAAVAVGVPLGVAGAARAGSLIDQGSRVAAVLGTSLPTFVLGYLLMWLFGVELRLLPVFGARSARHLVLPAMTLAAGLAGMFTRVIRSNVMTSLGEDHVRAARARGLPDRRVLYRHALRPSLVPFITLASLSLGHLLGGAVIVEWIFSWPGLGRLGVEAIHNRDYPMIQGWVLCMGAVFAASSLLADLVYVWIDPRVRLAQGAHA